MGSAVLDRTGTAQSERRRPGARGSSPAGQERAATAEQRRVLQLQRLAGNRAVSQMLTVSRSPACACGGTCGPCSGEESQSAEAAPVQRQTAVSPAAPLVQRQVGGDVRTMTITPTWTRALNDANW